LSNRKIFVSFIYEVKPILFECFFFIIIIFKNNFFYRGNIFKDSVFNVLPPCVLTNNLKELTIMDRNIAAMTRASNIVAHNAAAIDNFVAAVTTIVAQPG
jgi:hypothetical protein